MAQRLDEIAGAIYASFRTEIEKDALCSFTERNKDAARFIRYSAGEFTHAVCEIDQIDQHLADGDIDDYYFKPSDMKELKRKTQEIFSLMNEAEEMIECEELRGAGLTLQDAVRLNVFNFYAYLAASDGFFARKELKALEETLHISWSGTQMKKYILDNNIYTVSFDQKAPETLTLLVKLDNGMKQTHISRDKGYAESFVDLMEEAGRLPSYR